MDAQSLLKNISMEELEKLRMIASIFGMQTNNIKTDATIETGTCDYEKKVEFGLAPKSLSCVRTVNRKLLLFYGPNRKLYTIEKRDAENFVIKISDKAPKGVNTYLSTLHAEFQTFLEWNYIMKNPFAGIKLQKVQKEKLTTFESKQLKFCIGKLEECGFHLIAQMVILSFLTGMRGGEIVNLRWSDIDLKKNIITVGNKDFKTKSRKKRIIPFKRKVKKLLTDVMDSEKERRIYKEDGFVCVQNNGKQYQLDSVSKRFKKVIRELGLPEELHWHSLRHTAASNWVNRKVPIYTVQKLLGHSSPNTTQIYAKVDVEELREAVE